MTKQEGVISVYNEKGELIAIVKLDEISRKKIIYKVEEADIDFITNLINETENKPKG